jgi:hypothetical protein
MGLWNEVITQQYKLLMDGRTPEERKEVMRGIQEEYGVPSVMTDNREPVTRVKAYVKQFEDLVSQVIGLFMDFSLMGPSGNLCIPDEQRHRSCRCRYPHWYRPSSATGLWDLFWIGRRTPPH